MVSNGRNLQSLLFKRKTSALVPSGECGTFMCHARGCQTCALVSNTGFLHHNCEQIKTTGGNCKSWNVVYCFQCKICNILYVGKTVDPLHTRVNSHRHKFYDVLKHSDVERGEMVFDDEQILGAHLANEHNLRLKTDFNINYKVFIMAHCNPVSLRKTEQFWINKLRTRRPYGLNQNKSVGEK